MPVFGFLLSLTGMFLLIVSFSFYVELPGSAKAARWFIATIAILALGLLCMFLGL